MGAAVVVNELTVDAAPHSNILLSLLLGLSLPLRYFFQWENFQRRKRNVWVNRFYFELNITVFDMWGHHSWSFFFCMYKFEHSKPDKYRLANTFSNSDNIWLAVQCLIFIM